MAAASRDSKVIDLSDYRRRLVQPAPATAQLVVGPIVLFWAPVLFLVPLWRLG